MNKLRQEKCLILNSKSRKYPWSLSVWKICKSLFFFLTFIMMMSSNKATMNKPIVLQLSTVIDNWHIHGCQILVGIKFCIKHKAAFTKINLFLITYTYNAVPRQIFISWISLGTQKWAQIFKNVISFFLTLISLITAHSSYLNILYFCLVVWNLKQPNRAINFVCLLVCMMVHSPIFLLQSHPYLCIYPYLPVVMCLTWSDIFYYASEARYFYEGS